MQQFVGLPRSPLSSPLLPKNLSDRRSRRAKAKKCLVFVDGHDRQWARSAALEQPEFSATLVQPVVQRKALTQIVIRHDQRHHIRIGSDSIVPRSRSQFLDLLVEQANCTRSVSFCLLDEKEPLVEVE